MNTPNALYAAFGTVKEYETNGVVLDFGVCKFKIRRSGGANRLYATAFSAKMRPHRRAIDAGTLTDDAALDLLLEVYFEAVIVSWENVTDEEGNVLDLNLGNFKKVMRDLPDLWNTLRAESDNIKNFQAIQVREDGEALGKS